MPQLIKTKAIESGAVDDSKILLRQDNYLVGRNAADSANIDVLKVNASDEIEMGKLPYGPDANAPVADAQFANKKYVDDQIGAVSGALVYRGSLAAPADITAGATGNAYIDGATGYVQGDYFKISSAGDITVSDGTIAVDIGDAIIINKDVALIASVALADVDKIDNTEAADILRSGDLSSAQIFVGNGSNEATAVSMSGDIAIDNAGATTIQANAVITTKINDGAVTEAKLDSGVDAETFVIAVGYTTTGATGNVSAGQTLQEAIRRVEKKADDALGGSGLDPESEALTMTATEVTTNKYVDLAFKAKDDELLNFEESSGATLIKGVDFTTSEVGGVTRVSWTGLGLDGYVAVGDVFQISYIKG